MSPRPQNIASKICWLLESNLEIILGPYRPISDGSKDTERLSRPRRAWASKNGLEKRLLTFPRPVALCFRQLGNWAS